MHLRLPIVIIRELLDAGARIEEVGYPTGNADVDAVLQLYRGLA
jgi:hypothetical protein